MRLNVIRFLLKQRVWEGNREEKERKGKERKGKERKGKERKGKERKGKERKGKERIGKIGWEAKKESKMQNKEDNSYLIQIKSRE